MPNSKELLSVTQAAQMLHVSKATLDCWRSNKRYPLPYYKIGRCVRYKMSDLLDFISRMQVGNLGASP